MNDYPVDLGRARAEVWHGDKMLMDLPPELSSPTARCGDRIYWVNEVVELSSGQLFVPERFYREPHPGRDGMTPSKEYTDLQALGWLFQEGAVSHFGSLFLSSLLLNLLEIAFRSTI